MTLLGCGNTHEKDITVIGKAENAKEGALVITKDDKVYFIDSLAFWDEKTLYKTVKVSGRLFVEHHKAAKKGEPVAQRLEGTRYIIQKPKWEVVN